MKKLMIVFSLLLGMSVVFLGGRSYAQYTQGTSYWSSLFEGMAPISQGPAEGFDQDAHSVTDWQRMTGGLSAFDPATSESMEATMEGGHQPSDWDRVVGGLSPFAPYSGQ